MVKVALDAMGGDHAPEAIVQGAVAVANEDLKIILAGKKESLEAELAKYPEQEYIEIVDAPEIIEMEEEPARAVRVKKDSSIVKAAQLVGSGEADALVSAGSTGAQLAASIFYIGRIKQVKRPAICTIYPTAKGFKLLTDAGANPDAKPEHILQFAQMGSIYARKILNISNPTVGLISNGTEAKKGNETARQAYTLLEKESSINFRGNIEGRDIPAGDTDVMVCDGFVGNIILKLTEGLATTLFGMIKEKLTANIVRKLAALVNRNAFRELKKELDYSEYGGAPLVGVQGVSMICHGSSNSLAISNALRAAVKAVESGYVREIENLMTEEKNEKES